MNSATLKLIFFLILATFSALYLGIAAATAQQEAVSWIVGGSVLITCVLLGTRIWLLIPFLGSMQLTLMIPGKPTTMLLAQALVGGFTMLILFARRLNYKLKLRESEIWIILLTLCVVQVYGRNPIGINLFGGESVGGRPYIIYAASLFTALLFCGLKVPPSELRAAMRLSILGGLLNFVLGVIGLLFPNFGMWFGFASQTNANNAQMAEETTRATRIEGVRVISQTLALTVASRVNPVIACLLPKWAPLILLSLVFAALSGYRNVFAAIGLTYLVGLFYHGRLLSVIGAMLMGGLFLAILAFTNLVMPLPANIQRSLSFLPGTWQQEHKLDAASSTEWRMEIWKEALFTDRWIQNKILGDGLGFSANELAMQQSMAERKNTGRMGVSGFDAHRDAILANGDYHSGPVSAVRTIGYIGLFVMALAQFRLVVLAHRQVLRCRGTEWSPVAMFFCIPIIWSPVFFWLIYGGFGADGPAILMAAGMIRLLENNLPLPAYAPGTVSHRAPYIPAAHQILQSGGRQSIA